MSDRYSNPKDYPSSLSLSDLGNRELRLVVNTALWTFSVGVVAGFIIAYFVHLFR